MDYKKLGEVLRFSAADAADVISLADASALAHHAALGDHTALGALGDYLQDHDHPAAKFVYRAAAGEGEGDVNSHFLLEHNAVNVRKQPHDVMGSVPRTPIVHPALNDEHDLPEHHGALALSYLHLPHGHFVHLRLRTVHPDTKGSAGRSFLLPTTPEEMAEYGAAYNDIHPAVNTAETFKSAAEGKPEGSVELGSTYRERMENAGLGHLLPAHQFSRKLQSALCR